VCSSDLYVIYRLPLLYPGQQKRIIMLVHGDYLIGLAPQVSGKPGDFRSVVFARCTDKPEEVVSDANWHFVIVDIPPQVAATGACFLKIADGSVEKPPGATVLDVSVLRR